MKYGFNFSTGAKLPDAISRPWDYGKHSHDELGRQRHLLMLGGGLMQLPAIRMAKEEGWFVIVADGSATIPGRDIADAFEHVDLKDKDGMLVMAKSYFTAGRLHGVFTAATDFSATVAWVAENLGLPGIPYEVALNASDKLRMRTIFARHNIASPGFVEIAAGQSSASVGPAGLSYPLVVKPSRNMGARGVSRVDSPLDLKAAIDIARSHSRGANVIVEEFIEGAEYSIDSLVYNGILQPCGIALRHIYFPPYFVEMGHTLPCGLSPQQEKSLLDVFSKAVSALGITNGAAKGDVFFGPKGPVIGEIAARLSGGYMSGWTFPLASGVEVTRAALFLAMGLAPPSLEWRRHMVSAERAVISVPGTLSRIEGVDDAIEVNKPDEVFFRVKPGDKMLFPKNNVEKSANVVVADRDRRIAIARAQNVVQACILRLVPGEESTHDYLFRAPDVALGQERFPEAYPSHFAVLRAQIKQGVAFEEKPRNPQNAFADLRYMFSGAGQVEQNEKDWAWQSLDESAARLKVLFPGFSFENESGLVLDDLILWLALLRGSTQLAIWVLDTMAQQHARKYLYAEKMRQSMKIFIRGLS